MSTANAQQGVVPNNLLRPPQRPGGAARHGQRSANGNGNRPMMPNGASGASNGSRPRNATNGPRRGGAMNPGQTNRGNARNGLVVASGGQVMLQRQKPQTQDQRQRQRHSAQQNQVKQRQQILVQEQEVIAGVSMKQVNHDIFLLEVQQQQAQQNCEQAEKTLQQEKQKEKQINQTLEELQVSNGKARGELENHREFLHIAHRQMEERKSRAGNLHETIESTEKAVDTAYNTTVLFDLNIRLTDNTITSIASSVAETDCQLKKLQIDLKQETQKCQRIQSRDQNIRSLLDVARGEAQDLIGTNKETTDSIKTLKNDESETIRKEEEAKAELQALRDKVKAKEEQLEKLKEAQAVDVADCLRQEKELQADLDTLESSVVEESESLEAEKKKLVEVIKAEGWTMEVDDTFDLEGFTTALKEMEATSDEQVAIREENLRLFEEEVKEMEQALKLFEQDARGKDEEAEKLSLEQRTANETAEKKKAGIDAIIAQLETLDVETTKLEGSHLEKEKELETDHLQHIAAKAVVVAKKEELQLRLENVNEQIDADNREFLARDERWLDIEKIGLDHGLAAAQHAADEAQKAFDLHAEKKHSRKAKEKDAKKKIAKILKRHPILKSLQFDYNSSEPDDKQKANILAELKEKCEAHKLAASTKESEPEEPDALFKDGSESPYPALGASERRSHSALSAATDKHVHWKDDGDDDDDEDTLEEVDPHKSVDLFEGDENFALESEEPSFEDREYVALELEGPSHDEIEESAAPVARDEKQRASKPAKKRSSKASTTVATKKPTEKPRARRRSRKKVQDADAPKEPSYFQAVSNRSVLESIPQPEKSRDNGQKSKDENRRLEKTLKEPKFRNRTEHETSLEKVDRPKAKKASSNVETKKRRATDSKTFGKRTEKTLKVSKDRDPDRHSKKTSKAVDLKVKDKSSRSGRDEAKKKSTLSSRDDLEKKDRVSKSSLSRHDKHSEKEKTSKSSRDDRQKKEKKVSRASSKIKEVSLKLPSKKDKTSRDDRDKKRKAKDQNLKDDRQKRIKSKSSRSRSTADDASKASKNSKARRSRKKSGATQPSQSQKFGMDDDFGGFTY